MRRFPAIFLALTLLFALPALAYPAFDEDLIADAKEVLGLLSYGEMEKAYDTAAFERESVTLEDFSSMISANFLQLSSGTVQRDVTVAWYDGAGWNVAIPVLEPSEDSVETLVFFSDDGGVFNGCAHRTWGEVVAEVDRSEETIWDVEYKSAAPLVVADTPQ